MEQIDIKMEQKVHELVRLMAKEEEGEMQFLALAGSVWRQQFVGVAVGVLDVKILIQHDGDG